MADSLDLELIQGDTFRWIITIQDSLGVAVDLTNCKVRGMLRKAYTDSLPTETFNVTYATQSGTTLGQCTLLLSAAETAAIAKGTYKYDVEIEIDAIADNITNNGEVYKLYRGTVVVLPEATK